MNALPSRIICILLTVILAPLSCGEIISDAFPIRVGPVNFSGTPLGEAMEFLALSPRQSDQKAERVNIILAVPAGVAAKPVTLFRERGDLIDALKATAAEAGCEVQVEKYAAVIRKKGAKPLPAIKGKIPAKLAADFDKVVIPKVSFNDTTIREAVNFLQAKFKQLDPENRGVSLVMKVDESVGGAAPVAVPAPPIPGLPSIPDTHVEEPSGLGRRITLTLENTPWLEVLRYTAGLADMDVSVEKFGLQITPVKAAEK